MSSVRWFGVGSGTSWVAALLFALASAACGSDANPPSPAGAGGEGGEPVVESQAGEASVGEGGAGSPVTPGDRVCKDDQDCATREKPVCDQVLGCVACQYDWDCPAGHRCQDNECFEKQPCAADGDCRKDVVHAVCDAVQQLCVGCREDAECGDGKRCEASECVAFEACRNSRDCRDGKVCDRAVGACVSCVVDGDCGAGSACVNDACVPTCASDKDCLGVGLLCNQQINRCVECLSHQDCPEQYHCAAGGRCALDACQQGQTRCENEHTLGTCSMAGDVFIGSTCAGDTRCAEQDELTAACTPLACAPGGSACDADGNAVEHCSGDGSKIESVEPCGEGKTCDGGACVDVVCAPGTFACKNGNSLYECNANGTLLAFKQSCGNTNYFACDQAAGQCRAKTCSFDEPICEGNFATQCAEDGMGGEPGGEDCDATGQVCYEGYCQKKLCSTPFVCSGSLLQSCRGNGTELVVVSDCGFAALCDQSAGKCIQPTCTPGAFACNGNVATRCKADGSGYEAGGVDCSQTEQVCDGGGCLAKSCAASATFCAGGNPQKCSPSGATYEPTDTCTAGEYCSEGLSTCQLDKCTAGSPVCNGNVVTTCASDGSGPLAGGTDCSATQQVCEAGACKSVVCTPGAKTCQGEAVYACNAKGTGTSLWSTCASSTFCDASSGTAECVADTCSAGSLGCNGEVISTCSANGGAWLNPGTDCKASGQVCTSSGTCAAGEFASQGSSNYSSFNYTNRLYYGGFRVLTSRKLGKLEIYATFKGLQKLTWVVYQKRAESNNYDLVYQKVTAQTTGGAAFIASPALDYVLEKGKTYAVGVHIAGTAVVYYSYTPALKAAFLTAPFGSYGGTGATQPDATITVTSSSDSYYPYLRLTTAAAP
jgi:hypothetical protein